MIANYGGGSVAGGGGVRVGGSSVGVSVGCSDSLVFVGGGGSAVLPVVGRGGADVADGAITGVGVRGIAAAGSQICCPTLNRSFGRQLTWSNDSTGMLARWASAASASPERTV